MKKIIFLPIVVLTFSFSFAQKSSTRQAILHVMQSQQIAWNNGDIDGFMKGYWKDDSLQFVSSKTITYGWREILDHYKKSYPNKASMGVLQFSNLQIQQLSPKACFVIGVWHLNRVKDEVGGHFTLLFKKINNYWVIVVDHTS
ncbi:YybH family protein [Arachidicoccus sp.]|uniref:YybH family protein n=1 Tax=Arachidicoccus sp. TaxID=1872624 RepID=UPI003D25F4A1